jgi:Tol biopolymer transport system component
MARRNAFRRAGIGTALACVAAAVALVTQPGAAVAGASQRAAHRPTLTVLQSPDNGAASLVQIEPDGRVREVWQCPSNRFCGDLRSVAWAPDGRKFAFSLTEFGARNVYPGLHIVDTKTGRDVHVTGLGHDVSARTATVEQWKKLYSAADRDNARFGCLVPGELSWSPDSSKIAYACPVARHRRNGSEIHLVNADGSRPRLLRTGTLDAAWPAWSPDGTRIAFSTAVELAQNTDRTTPKAERSDIYTVGLDGTGRRRIARQGVAPAWSPDGTAIAYRSLCGMIRLVTPAGRDATPGGGSGLCPGFDWPGWPAWSGDGTRLVIGGENDVVLVDPDGRHSTRVGDSGNSGLTAELRPVVRPTPEHPLATASLATPVAATGRNLAITLLMRASNGVASLALVGPSGGVHEFWRCPGKVFCGEVASVSWAPGGRRFAIGLDEFGGHSTYPGLHVIDLATGRDRKLFGLSDPFSYAKADAVIHTFGCWNPTQIAWSPDGSKIAYACATIRNRYKSSEIHIIDADGGHPRLLRTGTVGAAWPSWSPTGTRIAFSTGNWPREGVRTDTDQPKRVLHSVIYTVDLGGAHLRRIATGASPAWSPDGTTIAYRSDCGGRIRLATPAGADATPAGAARCPGIGPEGVPAWAPDGSALAIGNENGIFLLDPGGANLTLAPGSSRAGLAFEIRPALQPAP